MAGAGKPRRSFGVKSTKARRRNRSSISERIRLFGWDSRTELWHGPTDLRCCSRPDQHLLRALRDKLGKSWYGPLNCALPDERSNRFFILVHDLPDSAVASIYCDESKTGPAELVAVLPASRRSELREDFAFEFLAFAHFLGSVSTAAELQVHDAIATAIGDYRDPDSLVFSISTGLWPTDLDHVLSHCVEKVAVTLCEWLEKSSVCARRAGQQSVSSA